MKFSKYQATGNDFLFFDDRKVEFPVDPSYIQALCHRRWGVGGDGVILLQQSDSADVKMRIFNADGSEAESCGNGLLCFGRYLLDLGFEAKPYAIELQKEVVRITFDRGHPNVFFAEPSSIEKVAFSHEKVTKKIYLINTGVPHAVLFENFDSLLAKRVRKEYNTNVNFVQFDEEGVFVSTFERGVEDVTWGCGTAAVAVSIVCHKIKNTSTLQRIRSLGGELIVRFCEEENRIQSVNMLGSVFFIYSGELEGEMSYENWNSKRSQKSRI